MTGSSGHLEEALVKSLTSHGDEVIDLDLLSSPETSAVGSVVDSELVLARAAEALIGLPLPGPDRMRQTEA